MIEFSAKVKELINDVEKRKLFSKNAVDWAQKWSWETATSKLRNIQYRKAIALHKARDENYKHVVDIENALMKYH